MGVHQDTKPFPRRIGIATQYHHSTRTHVFLFADLRCGRRVLGLDCLTPILWHKIANGATESVGNGSGFGSSTTFSVRLS
jgi:hypothetical protein